MATEFGCNKSVMDKIAEMLGMTPGNGGLISTYLIAHGGSPKEQRSQAKDG